MLIYSRYFLFHAALATLIPLLAGNDSQDIDIRKNDIRIARELFLHVLAGNPLAAQCADIIDRLQPSGSLDTLANLDDIPTDWMGGMSQFPEDPNAFFTNFGWEDVSTEF